MSITPLQIQKIGEIANLIYDFLPANPHPFADPSISFPGCATKIGIGNLWKSGSKRPAITLLLRNTLEQSSGKFCPLMIEVVQTAILYRSNKGNPILREDIEELNNLIYQVGYKIPELRNNDFLRGLPAKKVTEEKEVVSLDSLRIQSLRTEYIGLTNLEPHKRGYAFQDFLIRFFDAYGLKAKASFRITGEEIDGSFELNGDIYLVEAKWHTALIGQKDLAAFSVKVAGKSTWSRGLFISYAGYTRDGLEAFARGKSTNLIGMNGQDIFFILDGKLSLSEAIQMKARRAAETNDFFVSVFELSNL